MPGVAGLEACPLEVRRGGPSYTVDTLFALHALHPEASLTLILGSDIARTLSAWHRPDELMALAVLLSPRARGKASRGRGRVSRGYCEVPGGGERGSSSLDLPEVPVSSSLVRARVAAGESLAGLVPPVLAAYIAEHALYLPAEVPAS